MISATGYFVDIFLNIYLTSLRTNRFGLIQITHIGIGIDTYCSVELLKCGFVFLRRLIGICYGTVMLKGRNLSKLGRRTYST